MQEAKWFSEEALQIVEKWKAKEKGKGIPKWMQISTEDKGEIRKPSSENGAKK